MPKFGDLISLSTATRAAAGMAVGVGVTMGVQHHMDSSEFSKDPQRTEIREDQQKKMSFEVQQLSKKLEEERQKLETEKQSLAKEQADLRDAKAALQRMQQAMTEQGVQAGVVAVETVQQVAQAKEQADEQPEEPKPDVVPTNNAPRRPAVFDGGGNKEKTNDKQNNDSKPSVAFGSSGDVVTIEKGGAVPDTETERLRKEVENLRRRLADDASKEKELREREERLLLAERRYLGSDEDDVFAESDAFGFDPSDDKKKVRNIAADKPKTVISAEPKKAAVAQSMSFALNAMPRNPKSAAPETTSTVEPKPATLTVEEELKIVEEIFNSDAVKGILYLPKKIAENVKAEVTNPDAIKPRDLVTDKKTLGDPEGYLKSFQKEFPMFDPVRSYGLLKNISQQIANNIEHLNKDDKDAIKTVSREEVFEALQRSVKKSASRYLTEKMQPVSPDPKLQAFCKTARSKYSSQVLEIETVPGTGDAVAVFQRLKDDAEKKYREKFDAEGLLKNKKRVLQEWFDMSAEIKALDFEKLVEKKKPGGVPPPPSMFPGGNLSGNWIKGNAKHRLPSSKDSKGQMMPKFRGSATDFGCKIIEALRIFDEKFKQKDAALSKAMLDLWNKTEPKDTGCDKAFEKIAKERDEFWGKHIVSKQYDLLGLQYCVCHLPKITITTNNEDGTTKTFDSLDLPDYDTTSGKVKKILEYFGSIVPTAAFGEQRLRKMGVMRDDNADTLKKAYTLAKKFQSLLTTMEAMRNTYTNATAERTIGASGSLREENGYYEIVLPSLEALDSDELYKVLSGCVHKIRSLEIASVGKESCYEAFGRFLKLCKSMDHLKSLKITAPWCSNLDSRSIFYIRDRSALIRKSTLSSVDPKNEISNEEQFLAAIDVIPNLEEIHILKSGKHNATLDTEKLDLWVTAIGNCKVVELPTFSNLSTLLNRLCQLNDIATRERRVIICGNSEFPLSRSLAANGNLESIGSLLKTGKGMVTVQFDGPLYDFSKEMEVRIALSDFSLKASKTFDKRAKSLLLHWMEKETDEGWIRFLKDQETALGKESESWIAKKEMTLDIFQKELETLMEILSIPTFEWGDEVVNIFSGKKENFKYTAAYGVGYLLTDQSIDEIKREKQKGKMLKELENFHKMKQERYVRWRRTHAMISDFWKQAKTLPVFIPSEAVAWQLPEDKQIYSLLYHHLSPLVLAALLHLDEDGKNYYFFGAKDRVGSSSINLVFPGIAHGPLFGIYRKTGRCSDKDGGDIYSRAFLYGKIFAGKAYAPHYTEDQARTFSAKYDSITLKSTHVEDVVRWCVSADFKKTPKTMSVLSKLSLSEGNTIFHRKIREDGQPTETALMDLIRALSSGFKDIEKLEPLEEEIGKKEKQFYDLNERKITGVLSAGEVLLKDKLEGEIDVLRKKQNPVASDLKRCINVLKKRKAYIKGLVTMIDKYKTEGKIYRVELDGRVIKANIPDPFAVSPSHGFSANTLGGLPAQTRPRRNSISGLHTPKIGATGTAKSTNTAPQVAPKGTTTAPDPNSKLDKTKTKNKFNNIKAMFEKRAAANPTTVPLYPDLVDKWVSSGKKIKYYSNGTLKDHIDHDEKVMSRLLLSDSDPEKAKCLAKGQEPNEEAVARYIGSGQIKLVEEIIDATGAGTGQYHVRFPIMKY